MNNNNKHEKQSNYNQNQNQNQNNPQKSAHPSQGKDQCSSMKKDCHCDQKADKSERSSEHKKA